ncbi:MAG: beta-ketoacyl-ACP synthase 3, partial [Candidatus Binataceae bacterium]
MGSRIVGTGRGTPCTPVTNQDLERFLDTSDEWIRSRTGIGERYALRTGESLVDVTLSAVHAALDRAGLSPSALDAIVAGTVSSEYAFPAFACQIQHALGVSSIPAFDVAAACSGFVFALSVADASMRAGDWKRVLVIGADALSTMVDWTDRRTAVLFGDGAGAAVLIHEAGPRGVLASLMRSAGEFGNLLSVRATGVRGTIDSEVRRSADGTIKMKGPELFKIAVKSMEEVTRTVAEKAGVSLDDICLVVPHQANLRIIDAVTARLGIPAHKVFTN